MPKKKVALLLWKIYLESCVCSMDYYTTCDCSAQFLLGNELENLLGKNWHDIMKERTNA